MKRRVIVFSAYGLVLFGVLLILNQEIWPKAAPWAWDLLGMSVKTNFIGLATIMVGAIVLVGLASKNSR